MATIKLAPEIETKVESIAEMQDLLAKKYRFDSTKVNISEIGITEDYHLVQDSKDYEITDRALRKFLRRLGIPPKFGMKIPEDLLGTIVKKLRTVKPQEVQLFTKKNTIYGIAGGRYQPPDLVEILEPLNDMKREIKMARVGSEGFRLATLGPQIIWPREKDKKDQMMIGIQIAACATGQPMPWAQLMTYRLICSNGAIAGKALGEVRWPKRLGNDENAEHYFVTSLAGLVDQETKLIEPVKKMANRHMLGNEFHFIWKYLKKYVGPEKADELLQASKEERAKIIATVKVNRKEHQDYERVNVISAYEAFNNISALANTQPGASSEKLQKVAGLLISRGSNRLEKETEED